MLSRALLIIGTLVGASLSNPISSTPTGFCRTPSLSEEEKQHSRQKLADANLLSRLQETSVINVPTYFHVIASSRTEEGGYLKESTMMAQLEQLNSDYAGTGFNFTLMNIDWTVNSAWAKDQDSLNMRTQLRRGGYNALNLYFQNSFEGGYCYFPKQVVRGSNDFSRDGCYISMLTVPGGSSETFSGGKVATHEVGHWLFLYHTFQDGCSGEGDEVDDTPAEDHRAGAQGCPTGSDTCSRLPGLDPIHNHMTYTADPCRYEFTTGQITRMTDAWYAYREGN